MKLVAWSLMINDGLPRLATNRRYVAMNAAVDRFVTNSKCIAFTESETNTATYAFVMVGRRTRPDLISTGPA